MHINETYLSFFLLSCSELRDLKLYSSQTDWTHEKCSFFLTDQYKILSTGTPNSHVHIPSPHCWQRHITSLFLPAWQANSTLQAASEPKTFFKIDISLMFYVFNNWFTLLVLSENSICAKWNFLWWTWDANSFYLKKIPLLFYM